MSDMPEGAEFSVWGYWCKVDPYSPSRALEWDDGKWRRGTTILRCQDDPSYKLIMCGESSK